MKKITSFIIIALLINTGITLAQNAITHTAISFKIKNLGINTGGTIGGLQANVHFNPSDLATSTLEATVEVSTLTTENSSRDEHLRSADFFDLAKYPKISLKSISFKHKSGNNYSGMFNLTIKDKTRLIEIPFTYVDKGTSATFSSTFKINRLDFGVGGDSMVMANDVTVVIDAEAGK